MTSKLVPSASKFRWSITTGHGWSVCPVYAIKRTKANLPHKGLVAILCITDKQFGDMELFYGHKPKQKGPIPQQLEMF